MFFMLQDCRHVLQCYREARWCLFDYRGNTSDHFIVEFGGDLLKIKKIIGYRLHYLLNLLLSHYHQNDWIGHSNSPNSKYHRSIKRHGYRWVRFRKTLWFALNYCHLCNFGDKPTYVTCMASFTWVNTPDALLTLHTTLPDFLICCCNNNFGH